MPAAITLNPYQGLKLEITAQLNPDDKTSRNYTKSLSGIETRRRQ